MANSSIVEISNSSSRHVLNKSLKAVVNIVNILLIAHLGIVLFVKAS